MGKANKNKRKTTPQGDGKKMERFGLLYPHSPGIEVGSILMVVSYTVRTGGEDSNYVVTKAN